MPRKRLTFDEIINEARTTAAGLSAKAEKFLAELEA